MISSLFKDSELADILEKVEAGKRINEADALRCLNVRDIAALGAAVDLARKRVSGNQIAYSSYLNINYTNICDNACGLCAFYKERSDKEAFLLSVQEIQERISRAVARQGIGEVHIVGGINREIPFSYALEMVQKIREANPHLFIKAFSAVEIAAFAQRESQDAETILARLKKAGLSGLPGGGAEIFSDRVRQIICSEKICADEWLNIHKTAHKLTIPTNATMLYGHIETPEEIVDHMKRLRDLQDETQGFQSFVPLPFHPQNTAFDGRLSGTDGFKDVRIFAAARIYLDNIPHLKALWPSLGVKFSQVLLSYGADDLGGTALQEKIFHDAGALTPETLLREDIENMIREIDREPVEADSNYDTAGS